ncbi:MAG: bifunctional acetate--CoA ligase family protein/GNAT family N-acetyltransferase [Rhizobacter sp.]
MSIRHLDRLLEPRSIAVIGASSRIGSVGATVWRNLRAGAFKGPVHAVNLKKGTLDGETVFARPALLPEPPDLAVLCTPPDSVPGLIAELGKLGTRAAIVMTAGLDAVQKRAMLDAARPYLLRVLGPNCLGLLSPRLGLNASFAHTDALPGDMAFVSQSGALVTAVLDWAKSRRIGFSHMISLGEHADVDFGDLLDHLASDPHTRSILLYIESVESPRKFMSAARAASRNKPVIVVKAGRAGQGMKAAASHTGALAGSDIVFDAAIRRAGMLRVDTLQDLFMAAQTLARFRPRLPAGLTIMTNGGGAGVMAADAAALSGVALRDLGGAVVTQLNGWLPSTWSHANPIDIIGDAPVERYTETLKALLADPQTGAVLFMHAPTAIVNSADIARACEPLVRQSADRLMSCWLGAAAVAEARSLFESAGVANYDTPEEAVRALALCDTFQRNQTLLSEAPTASENRVPDVPAARGIIDKALQAGSEMLDESEGKALLQAYGIPTVRTLPVAATAEAAVAAAQEIGYPVALKIRSPDISHKSDAGGVRLGLRDDNALRDAVNTMLLDVRRFQPQARIEGFTVQSMGQRPMAQELIVGASVDPLFGPVILFGQGGTAVEVLADTAIGLPPLNRVLARDLVSRTRVAKLMAGYRDHPPVEFDAVCDVLVAVSQMLADLPELAELDINPLWADDHGVLALDARVRLTRAASAGTERFSIVPYPSELAETVTWQGCELLLRPIRPEDETLHREFIEHLAAEDLRLRFFSSRRELPRSELARLVQIDYAREMAFIAIERQADGSERTVGVVRAVSDPDNVEAEFAVTVRSELKGHGLGHLLMSKIIAYAGSRGTQCLVGEVLRENQFMQALARELGFVVDPRIPTGPVVCYRLDLNPPSSTPV